MSRLEDDPDKVDRPKDPLSTTKGNQGLKQVFKLQSRGLLLP